MSCTYLIYVCCNSCSGTSPYIHNQAFSYRSSILCIHTRTTWRHRHSTYPTPHSYARFRSNFYFYIAPLPVFLTQGKLCDYTCTWYLRSLVLRPILISPLAMSFFQFGKMLSGCGDEASPIHNAYLQIWNTQVHVGRYETSDYVLILTLSPPWFMFIMLNSLLLPPLDKRQWEEMGSI